MTNPYYGYPQGAPWGPSPPPPPPYGPPPPGRWIPPGSGWGPPASAMPRRRTRGWLLATVALFLMTVTAAGAIIAYQHHKNSDPSKIKVLLSVFSEAVRQEHRPRAGSYTGRRGLGCNSGAEERRQRAPALADD